MARIFYDQDAQLELLQGKKVSIIGFGSQGSAQGQNLRDSGIEVIIAELPGTPGYEKAKKVGFSPVSAEEAAQKEILYRCWYQINFNRWYINSR